MTLAPTAIDATKVLPPLVPARMLPAAATAASHLQVAFSETPYCPRMAPKKKKKHRGWGKRKTPRRVLPADGADQLLKGVLEVLLEEHRGLRSGRRTLRRGEWRDGEWCEEASVRPPSRRLTHDKVFTRLPWRPVLLTVSVRFRARGCAVP